VQVYRAVIWSGLQVPPQVMHEIFIIISNIYVRICLFILTVKSILQFIGATMGTSELQLQTENGHIGMPSNVCCVVVEYCPGGALKTYLIKNRRRKLAFKVVVQLALDLARGSNLFALSVSYKLKRISFFFKPEKSLLFTLQVELSPHKEDCPQRC